MKRKRIQYYDDELKDEFSTAQITPKPIDSSYRYDRTSRWERIVYFFWYRLVAPPLALGFLKTVHRHRIFGKEKLRDCREKGCFLYGNHTQDIGDALIPHFLRFTKRTSLIVHPNNVSMPILGRLTPYLGAIPLPDDMEAYRHFLHSLDRRIEEGHQIVIYPEAHIWPYYTGIRPFSDESFIYPVRAGVPVFCFTNTYQKRHFGKKPRIVTYVDGPFLPDPSLSPRKQRRELRDRIYETMKARASLSEIAFIQYIKRSDAPADREESQSPDRTEQS